MKYKVESIGAAFSDKAIAALSRRLNEQCDQGWELHTVFAVEKTGCLGSSEGKTYLAIFRSNDASSSGVSESGSPTALRANR